MLAIADSMEKLNVDLHIIQEAKRTIFEWVVWNFLTYSILLSTYPVHALGRMGQEKQGVSAWAALTEQNRLRGLNFKQQKFFLFKKIFYLFLERGKGKEKERERNINVWLPLARPSLGSWPATQACALTRNQTSDLLVHSLALNH